MPFNFGECFLQLVQEVFEAWHDRIEAFAVAHVGDDCVRLGAGLLRVSRHQLPVIKHALRERRSVRLTTQVFRET